VKSLASDNYAGALPEVIEAITAVNIDHAPSYGSDPVTQRTKTLIQDVFGSKDAEILFVFNGTGANVLSITAATQSFNSVLCADTSHIYNDESSAPETISGCRFFPLPANEHGKLSAETVSRRLIRKGDVHYAQPKLLSITQSTEYGTVYTPDEIKSLSEITRANDMFLHMDGSRFWNAAAGLHVNLREISTDAGVDILSLGGTKLGLLFGEAVIVFNKKLAETIRFRQKQVMQLASKTRFIAAQFEAILTNELWRKTATHANQMAQLLADGLKEFNQVIITKPVEANVVFAEIPLAWNEPLMQQIPFYVWQEHTNEVRLMCAWDTKKEEIRQFIDAVRNL